MRDLAIWASTLGSRSPAIIASIIAREDWLQTVEAAHPNSCINAVNLAEVLLKSKVKGYNGGLDELLASLVDMGLTMVPFDTEQAALVPFVHAQGELLGQ